MDYEPPLRQEQLDALLAEVLEIQRAEGLVLTAEEIAEVRSALNEHHPSPRTWSPSWSSLATVALALHRPDLLRAGRSMEMFASGAVIVAGVDLRHAWGLVCDAHAAGRRWFVRATLELIEHGPQESERCDRVRFAHIAAGIAAARAAGWTAAIRELLRSG